MKKDSRNKFNYQTEKVAFNLGSKLEGLLYRQQNILGNQFNNRIIDHNGQADSIIVDGTSGVYEISTIPNGHPGYFLCGREEAIK